MNVYNKRIFFSIIIIYQVKWVECKIILQLISNFIYKLLIGGVKLIQKL